MTYNKTWKKKVWKNIVVVRIANVFKITVHVFQMDNFVKNVVALTAKILKIITYKLLTRNKRLSKEITRHFKKKLS